MDVMRRCERCMGTGELESSDSTDDRWWDCATCDGTGKVKDRRRPDPRLVGAVDDAAIERAAAVLAEWNRRPSRIRQGEVRAVAEAMLRAAFGGQSE